ncbi:hypothetical protein I3A86_24480, partial [Salmonella enterica]|nr:hypothetical protein [Salmonella enterica]
RVGRRPVFLASRLGFAALAVPGFAWLAARGDAGALVAVSAGLAALNALGAPPGLCLIAEAMPGAARATGLALAYTIGSSLFGGLSQPAATALIGWTGDALSPAYLLVAAGLVGAAGSFALLDAAPGAVSPPP